MGIIRNEIYSQIEKAVTDVYEDAFCTSVYEPVPPSFPAVYIHEIGNVQPARYVDLSNADDIQRVTWEIQIFSDKAGGKMSEAYAIADLVETAMRKMLFVRGMRQPLDNASDTSIFRLACRYSRIIGGGNSLEYEDDANEGNEE